MAKIKLKEICSFSKGSQINGDKLIENGKYDYLNGGINPSGKWSNFNVSGGTITISEGGNSCGYVNYMQAPFWCGAHCYYLYDLRCEVKYLYYALKSQQARIMKLRSGACMPNIKKVDIGTFEFEYSNNSETQKQIADNLDKVTRIIDLCNAILEKLDLLVKSRFVEMFGEIDLTPQKTEWTPISAIGTVVGGSTPKTSVEDFWDGDLKWITPAELFSDTGYLYDSVRKITKSGANSCSLQLLPKNTVILTSRAPIGKVAILGTEMYCNQGFKNIICNTTIMPRYLYSILLYNTNFLNSLGRGATFKEISKSIVEKIRIPVPPIELQEQFADFVKQVDKSKLAVKQILAKAEILKNALMQEYFG